MSYLLDTNACIAVINGRPASIRARLRKAVETTAQVFIPTIAVFELWYGVAKSSRPEANTRLVESFLAGPVSVLPFDEFDAKAAEGVRAALEASGRPIGAYDLLIAGQALRHRLTLVSANAREFGRIRGLVFEDWS